MMIKRLFLFNLVLAIAVVFTACNKQTYKGSQLSKREIQRLKDEKSYNARQANEIVEYNKKHRTKIKHVEEKNRERQQEYLEALNKIDKTGKFRRVKDPVAVDFY